MNPLAPMMTAVGKPKVRASCEGDDSENEVLGVRVTSWTEWNRKRNKDRKDSVHHEISK